MAITTKEELNILSRSITPTDSDYDIHMLVEQIAVGQAETFLASAKNIARGSSGYAYLDKMTGTCRKILQGTFSFMSISKVIIALVSRTNIEYNTITGANTDAWSNFIEANIAQAIETVAIVLPQEKTDYDAV